MWKLDRFGRSPKGGVGPRESLDTATPGGEIVFRAYGAVTRTSP